MRQLALLLCNGYEKHWTIRKGNAMLLLEARPGHGIRIALCAGLLAERATCAIAMSKPLLTSPLLGYTSNGPWNRAAQALGRHRTCGPARSKRGILPHLRLDHVGVVNIQSLRLYGEWLSLSQPLSLSRCYCMCVYTPHFIGVRVVWISQGSRGCGWYGYPRVRGGECVIRDVCTFKDKKDNAEPVFYSSFVFFLLMVKRQLMSLLSRLLGCAFVAEPFFRNSANELFLPFVSPAYPSPL